MSSGVLLVVDDDVAGDVWTAAEVERAMVRCCEGSLSKELWGLTGILSAVRKTRREEDEGATVGS